MQKKYCSDERLIINLIEEHIHAHFKQTNNFEFDSDLLYESLLKEGFLGITKEKFYKAVMIGTIAVMGLNATANFALSHTGKHSPVYTGASNSSITQKILNNVIGGGSDRTEAIEVFNDTFKKGSIDTKNGPWKSLESLAIEGDKQEKVWNDIKNHPILRSIFIGNVFINSGSSMGAIPDYASIKFKDDNDLIEKLSALGEFDLGWKEKALELAKSQKTYKRGKITISFNNAWCGGYAAFMLQDGHGIPRDAVSKMSSNESYGNHMRKKAPKGMFTHRNKKPLDVNNKRIMSKLVPGAILQVGKSDKGRWAGHFVTITGVGIEDGNVMLYTIEGNTAPESATQALSLGIQELYDNFSGLEKSKASGKIADSFKRVMSGGAAGSGRAVSGKVRALKDLQGQLFSITLPKYSQKILKNSILALKGMQSQGKKLSKKEKSSRKQKRKTSSSSRKRNRQNSSYEIEGNVLLENYIKESIKLS